MSTVKPQAAVHYDIRQQQVNNLVDKNKVYMIFFVWPIKYKKMVLILKIWGHFEQKSQEFINQKPHLRSSISRSDIIYGIFDKKINISLIPSYGDI